MNDRMPRQRLAHVLGSERAAAERDYRRVLARQQLEHQLLLASAKRLLALPVEERLDRLAQAALKLAIRVERLGAELGRERAGAGRLPGAHEAHEDERYARLQPIRSSYARSAPPASSMWSPPNFSR